MRARYLLFLIFVFSFFSCQPEGFFIIFESNGGSPVNTVIAKSGERITKPDDPAKLDYIFMGWFTDTDLKNPFDFKKSSVSTDIILYAKWKDTLFRTVIFNSTGGSFINNSRVQYDKKVEAPDDPLQEGLIFMGWYSDPKLKNRFDFDNTTIKEAKILYARWRSVEAFNVNFNVYGGTYIGAISVNEGQTINRPNEPTKHEHIFQGWYKDKDFKSSFDFNSDTITKDLLLHAKWQKINFFQVSFQVNGGSFVSPQRIEENKLANAPNDPVKKDFVIDGWFTDSSFNNPFNFDTPIAKDTILYAKWRSTLLPVYTVSFNVDGGSYIGAQRVEQGKKALRPSTPIKDGYTFDGWTSDAAGTTSFDFANTTISADTTVYAQWELIPIHKITFDVNGGSYVATQDVKDGEKVKKPSDPRRDGYSFNSWTSDAGGTTPFDFVNTTISADTTIYAKWDKKYSVTFGVNGGSYVTSQEIAKDALAKRPSDPIKSGVMFENWYADSGLTTIFDFTTTAITSNTTIYAKWGPIPTGNKVTFEVSGGSYTPAQYIATGDSVSRVNRPSDPVKASYKFINWYSDSGFTTLFDFAGTAISADITIYAKWQAIHTITFSANGGSAVPFQQIKDGEKVTRPANPTKKNYKFVNWYTSATFNTVYDFNNTVNSDKVIHAKWSRYGVRQDDLDFSTTTTYGYHPDISYGDGYFYVGGDASRPYQILAYNANTKLINEDKGTDNISSGVDTEFVFVGRSIGITTFGIKNDDRRVKTYKNDASDDFVNSALNFDRPAVMTNKMRGVVLVDGYYYMVSAKDKKVYAMDTSGTRDTSKEFSLSTIISSWEGLGGITYYDGHFYVVDTADSTFTENKVFAYTKAGARASSKDFSPNTKNIYETGITYYDGNFYLYDNNSGDVRAFGATEN